MAIRAARGASEDDPKSTFYLEKEFETRNTYNLYRQADRFDIVRSHWPTVAPYFSSLAKTPTLLTYAYIEKELHEYYHDHFPRCFPVCHPLPRGFDLVLISNELHGQGARENRALLRNAYRCLNQGGRLVLRDVLINRAGTEPDWDRDFFRCVAYVRNPTAAVTLWMKCAAGSARRDSRAS